MPNIRIKDIPTTASATSSTDFIGIDGSANGTRKLNAFSPTFGGNLTVSGTTGVTATDLTLDTSGPSVKSSLSARAPRQGLVFDGSGSNGTFTAVPIGSGNFTVSALVNITSYLATGRIISRGSAWEFGVYSDGRIYLYNNTTVLLSTSLVPIGKACLVSYTKSGSSGTFYLNGISAGTVTDNNTYTSASEIGGNAANNAWLGTIQSFLIYNRALSASEVVALYEAGAPSGADYNTPAAGSADLKPSAGTYTYWFGTGSLSATAATSFTFAAGASSLGVRNISGTITVKAGTRYRVTVVASGLNSNASFATQLVASTPATSSIANGTTTVEITFSASGSPYFSFFDITSTAGGSISISSIQALGLLLAPDAAQAGGGLVWYDTSGNAANISWTSGVSWNVPTSGKMATSLNVNAAASLFASTSNSTSISDVDTTAAFITKGSGTPRLYFGNENAANRPFLQAGVGGGSLFMCIQPYGGNALFGSLTDSGNGKIQLATHTTSAGGIGFGTDTALFRIAGGQLSVDSTGNNPSLKLSISGTAYGWMEYYSPDNAVYFTSGAGKSLVLRTNGGTTALTITNTQVATFAAGVDVGAASYLAFTNRSAIRSSADGLIRLTNWSDTDFTRLQFGGTTASFPALGRNGNALDCLLADSSGYANIRAERFVIASGTVQLISGTNSPEGVITANVGSLFLRTNGGASTTLYVKESGTGNTGWVAK